jgi:hypothetical protein
VKSDALYLADIDALYLPDITERLVRTARNLGKWRT